MKVSIPITIVAVVLVVACLALGSTDPDPGLDDAITRLEQRLGALEQRVESLEKKLQLASTGRRPATIRPARPSVRRSRPQGWRRKEFNGVPYYIIPIERKPSQSRPRTR